MVVWAERAMTLLKIRPGEGARVGWMFLYSLVSIGGVVVIGRAIGRALFLSTLTPAEVPYKFILPPLLLVVAGAMYSRAAARYRLDRLVIGSGALMVGALLGFRLMLATPYGRSFWVLAGLFVLIEVVGMLVMVQFWTLAGDIFNAREAKRLFSLIAAGGTLANVLAGALLTAVAAVLSPENLIFVIAGAIALGLGFAWRLSRLPGVTLTEPTIEAARSKAAKTGQNPWRSLQRAPLLATITGLMLTTSVVTYVTDYQLDLTLQGRFGGDGAAMLGFLGSFAFWTGVAACVVQFLLAGVILERFGVTVGLLLLPIGVGLGSAMVLVSGGAFVAIILPRAADFVFRYTINDTSVNLLYLPIPTDARRRAKAVIESMVKPPVAGLVGLIFLGLRGVPGLSVAMWSVPALVLVGVWVSLALRARRQYVAALADAIQKRRLDLEMEELNLETDTTRRVLLATLSGSDELQVLHAVQLLEQIPGVDATRQIAPLLSYPSAEVRLAALRYLARTRRTHLGEAVSALFEDPDERVRGAAVETYCALHGPHASGTVAPFLDDDALRVRGETIVGLVKYGGLGGILRAAGHLGRLLESSEPHERAEGARAIGRLDVPDYCDPLAALFGDSSLEVRLSAIRAAGRLSSPALLPGLLASLGEPGTAAAAAQALGGYGAGIEVHLGEVLANPRAGRGTRMRVAAILQRIGTEEAEAILTLRLAETDDGLRTAVCRALARLRAQTSGTQSEAIQTGLMQEIRRFYELAVLEADVGHADGDRLLVDSIGDRKEMALERILYLLAALYPRRGLEPVRQALHREQGAVRAAAIELLDNLVSREVKELLLPMIEAPAEQLVEIGQKRLGLARRPLEEWLAELAGTSDGWLRACALYRIGRMGVNIPRAVETALAAEDALVRETAEVAQRWLSRGRDGDKERADRAARPYSETNVG